MKRIESKWFNSDNNKDSNNCPADSNPSVTSSTLSLDSFWGLFLIAGVASLSALIIFAILFFYRHRHMVFHSDSETSIWTRIWAMFRAFDQKDLSSHTFKKSEGSDDTTSNVHDTVPVMGSPTGNYFPPSPSIYSNCSESGSRSPFSKHDRAGTPSATPRASPELVEPVVPTIQLSIPNQQNNP